MVIQWTEDSAATTMSPKEIEWAVDGSPEGDETTGVYVLPVESVDLATAPQP